MSRIRLLVGTRKGAFIFTSDGKRRDWKVTGPHFAGWEIYHVKASPSDPNRIYASLSQGWFGQMMQRSDDGGETWEAVNNEFTYGEGPGEHLYYDGTPRPFNFLRVWSLHPSRRDPDVVLAGVEDAAVFRSIDGGKSWSEHSGLRASTGAGWQPGGGGLCAHTILSHPDNEDQLHVAISAAGVFGSKDGGEQWRPLNHGLSSDYIPDPDADIGHCVHRIGYHPDRPEVMFMQKHWDVMRTDDGGANWYEISGDLPSDFGFALGVHPHEKETVYVLPITADTERYPPEGKLRVYRSRSGGNEWEPLFKGLPQENCYVNVLRGAMSLDTLDPCGVYFGTTGGAVYASSDDGDSWSEIARDLPSVFSVEVDVLP